MIPSTIHFDWNSKPKCIRCGTQVASDRDFCSKDCEDIFLTP
ncbi:MAG: DUF2116 family Zn-ribbon domain-containing protein [Candidatus Hydrothermarchaeaceae archaeon]